MKFLKDSIIKFGETLVVGDLLRLEEDADGRVSIRATGAGGTGILLDDLTDVSIGAVATSQYLRYNGSFWANSTITSGDLPSLGNYLRLDGSTPMAANLEMQNHTINWNVNGFGVGLTLNNNAITGVATIIFSDPGTNEGLEWATGSGWRIYESPNNLTNAAGNLHIVLSGTRQATWDILGGYTQVIGPITVGDVTTPVAVGQDEFVATDGTRQAAAGVDTTRGLFGMRSNHEFSLMTSNTRRWTVDVNGHFLGVNDNTLDIGASGANRPRIAYLGTRLIIGADLTAAEEVQVSGRAYFLGPSASNIIRLSRGHGAGVLLPSKTPAFQIVGDDSSGAAQLNNPPNLALIAPEVGSSADQNQSSGKLELVASRSTIAQLNAGTFTPVVNGDILGEIRFGGDDTVNLRSHGARVYTTAAGTWTSASHPAQLYLATVASGTTGNAIDRWIVTATGHLNGALDNTYDFGQNGTFRPRSIYAGTSVVIGTDPTGGQILRVGGGARFTGDIAYDGSSGGLANSIQVIASTSDASDTKRIALLGGGGASTTRGAIVLVHGNEFATDPGYLILQAGDTGNIRFLGHILAQTDNTYDIGATGATRPRAGYFSDAIVIGTDPGGATDLRVGQAIRAREEIFSMLASGTQPPTSAATLMFGTGSTQTTFRGGFSHNVYWNGATWVLPTDGANSGGQLILGGVANDGLEFHTIISSGVSAQNISNTQMALYRRLRIGNADITVSNISSFRPSVAGGASLGTTALPWGNLDTQNAVRFRTNNNSFATGGFAVEGTANTSPIIARDSSGGVADSWWIGFNPSTNTAASLQLLGGTTLQAGAFVTIGNTPGAGLLTNPRLRVNGPSYFNNDIQVATLGVFDSTSTPITDYILSYNGSKWIARNVQLSFTTGDVSTGTIITGGVAGSAVSYVGGSVTSVKGGPGIPATPTTVAEYKAILVTLDSPAPAGTVWNVEADVDVSFTTGTVICETISQKFVHSRLTLGTTYYYRYRNRGTDGFGNYSVTSSVQSPSNVAETNSFGLILASQIATANISSINADIGDISAGKVRNALNTAGILLGAGPVPASWTQGIIFSGSNLSVGSNLTRYIDFGATGTNKVIKFDNAFSLDAQGNAVFSGTIQAGIIRNVTNIQGIRIDSGSALPGTWTTYIDLAATGTASLLHHPGLDLTADGRAIFSGVVNAGSIHIRNDVNVSTDFFSVAGQGLGRGYRFLFVNGNNLNSIIFSGTYMGVGRVAIPLQSDTTPYHTGIEGSTKARLEVDGQMWNNLFDLGDKSANFTIDWNNSNVQRVRLTGTGLTVTQSNGKFGGVYTLIVHQDGSGSRTITTWTTTDPNTNVEWPSSIVPTLTTTLNKADIFTFVKTQGISATYHYYGSTSGKNYSG